jgi:hypothetical protein
MSKHTNCGACNIDEEAVQYKIIEIHFAGRQPALIGGVDLEATFRG